MTRVEAAYRFGGPFERGFAFITDTANWSRFWPAYVRLEDGAGTITITAFERETVRDTILLRFARLDPAEAEILQAAAVLGRTFDYACESCRGHERSEWSLNFSPHAPAELAITSRSSDGSPTDRPARRTLRPAAIFLAM